MDDFNRLLDEWKNQYLQFLSTGEPSYKDASQRAQDAIDAAISKKREQVDAEKSAMKQFASSYTKGHSELASVTEDAQQIHDAFVTSKQRFDEWASKGAPAPSIDISNGYSILLRIGIFLILLPILLYVGYVFPSVESPASSTSSFYRSS